MGVTQFLTEQFWNAFPILVAAGFAIAIMIERGWALFLHLPMNDLDVFLERISKLVAKADFKEAMRLCEMNKRKPVAHVVMTALSRAHLPETVIYDGLLLSLDKADRAITKRTPYLATIANVATLMGLIGTIAGLVASFQAVAHADPQQKSTLLAAGISTAMNTTLLGLGVAVPCMVIYAVFMNRTKVLSADLESTAVRCLDIIKQRFYSSELVQSPLGNTSSTPENVETKQDKAA